MTNVEKEQQMNMKFCFKLRKTFAETWSTASGKPQLLLNRKDMPIEVQCEGDADCHFSQLEDYETEFAPKGTTINSEFYVDVLEHLRNDVCRKGQEK